MKPGSPTAASTRGAFALLEVVLSFALLALLAASATLVLQTGTRAASTALVCLDLEGTARRTLRRIADELAGAGANALVPDPLAPFGSASLVFQRIDGIDEELAVVWSLPVRLALRLEDGERDDGIDNDGDGRIDEHELVWTSDPGGPEERSVVWAHGVREYLQGEVPNGRDDNGNGLVDEHGLSLVRQGGRLTIRLSLLGRAGEGDEFARTVETTLRLCN